MQTLVSRSLIVALAAFAFSAPAIAQSQQAPAGTRVAVIDVSAIFRDHPGFRADMEAMKQKVKAFEGKLQQRGAQIKQLQQQMQSFKPGSADFKQKEAEILKIQAEGQAAAKLKQKDFLEDESKIYYKTYKEVEAEVAKFAQRYGIGLVVRFNAGDIDPDVRASVLEGVNRAVVYQAGLNITGSVLKQIQAKYPNMASKPGAPRK